MLNARSHARTSRTRSRQISSMADMRDFIIDVPVRKRMLMLAIVWKAKRDLRKLEHDASAARTSCSVTVQYKQCKWAASFGGSLQCYMLVQKMCKTLHHSTNSPLLFALHYFFSVFPSEQRTSLRRCNSLSVLSCQIWYYLLPQIVQQSRDVFRAGMQHLNFCLDSCM